MGGTNRLLLFVNFVALTGAVGCAAKTAAAPPVPQAPAAQVNPQEPQLADGPGRRILNTACTACHGLREVTKFNGFYTRPQWRDIVITMVEYGAPVSPKDVEVLSDYLTEQLGQKQ